jgi:LacI family transcriptional regulator
MAKVAGQNSAKRAERKAVWPPRKSPTIIDVAERAHASKSTVSNVLQGKAHVNEQTRERVLQAIAELGYRTNVAARNLRQRSRVLGVLVGDLRNPFHAEIAALIEQRASAEQHTMLLATTSGLPAQEAARVEALIEHRVAAVIFIAYSGTSEVLELIPEDVCRLFVSFRASGGTSIAVDENEGARLALEHLLSLGHERIAYVSTSLAHEPQTDEARYAGYVGTLKAHGIDPSRIPTLQLKDGESSRDAIKERIGRLLTADPRPTAIFAASDFTAIEVMEAADAAGLRIPGDLSVVGFDDMGVAGLSRISLTTVAQPMAELADHAVRRAIAMPTARRRKDVVLAPRLVVRSSTASPRSGGAARRLRG